MPSIWWKRIAQDVGEPICWPKARAEFRELRSRYPKPTPDDVLTISNGFKGAGWHRRLTSFQIEQEFREIIDRVAAAKPKIIMEIGTANGATLLAWSRIASELVISVDLPDGIHGGGYPVKKQKLFKLFVEDRPGVDMQLFRGSSRSPEALTFVKNALAGRPIDVLYIDGDHRYAGVKEDYHIWRPLVRPGGMIVFHDILAHHRDKECEVHLLWPEVQGDGKAEEIIASHEQGECGIGILTTPS